jgi:hypothetical protein
MKKNVGFSLLLLIMLGSKLSATETFDQIVSLWTAKKFDTVLPLLRDYRKQPFGRKWQVDYMIGTSDCHGTGDQAEGVAYLSNVLTYKDVPDKVRSATEQEVKFCLKIASATQPQTPSFYLIPIAGQLTDRPSVTGKGGYNFVDPHAVITTTKVVLTPVPIAELQKRVFASDQGAEAMKAAMARLDGQPKGIVEKGFVVVCTHCDLDIRGVADCLDRFKRPLQNQFDMVLPSSLVTVYIPEDIYAVQTLANRLHGIELPLGTLAYSVLEDLSMVGIAGQGCGSLAHELTHLSIRNNFGDSPAWLEEGLASEIAVGSPIGDSFRFGPSWRDSTLKQQWTLRPKVADLVGMNWLDFMATDATAVRRVAAVHAMAAVFVRYLEEKGKLHTVYFGIRDGQLGASTGAPRYAVSVLEHELGMKLSDIDKDFVRWFDYAPPAAHPLSPRPR